VVEAEAVVLVQEVEHRLDPVVQVVELKQVRPHLILVEEQVIPLQ
tara:strand:+ start:216 stop:350 length:135 start_codon:yes stop_codon:yes gene_type:complete